MIKEGFVVKNAQELKDSSGKVYSIKVSYYHEKNPDFIYAQTWSLEDFKKQYGDLSVNTIIGQKIKIKEELILK